MSTRILPAITDDREDVIAVDVLLVAHDGTKAWIGSSGLTTDDAIERAENYVSRIMGELWNYEDWQAV